MKRFLLAAALVFCVLTPVPPQSAARGKLRSLGDVYPNLGGKERGEVFSEEGFQYSGKGSEGPEFLPRTDGNPNIAALFAGKKTAFIIESLRLVPEKKAELLAVYNALGKIRNLKNRAYHSASRDDYVPLFEDAVRVESARKLSPLPDPPDAAAVPASETIFVRLKDVNFGTCYYEITLTGNGRAILCVLSNFKSINYSIFPVMKERAFTAALYIEPAQEGLLVYSAASADVSDFIAERISITSALRKRLDVITGWVIDGIK
jgi:hypothetical protein